MAAAGVSSKSIAKLLDQGDYQWASFFDFQTQYAVCGCKMMTQKHNSGRRAYLRRELRPGSERWRQQPEHLALEHRRRRIAAGAHDHAPALRLMAAQPPWTCAALPAGMVLPPAAGLHAHSHPRSPGLDQHRPPPQQHREAAPPDVCPLAHCIPARMHVIQPAGSSTSRQAGSQLHCKQDTCPMLHRRSCRLG